MATPADLTRAPFPGGYRRRLQRRYGGIELTVVSVYSRSSGTPP